MDKGQLLFSGATDDALDMIRGKVFEKSVDKEMLPQFQQSHQVISSKLVGGRPQIHIFAENHPGDDFKAAEETLEDVFFAKLHSLI